MKKKLCLCGVSHRAIRLLREMDEQTLANVELVGLFDVDPLRFGALTSVRPEYCDVPTYCGTQAYEKMLVEQSRKHAATAQRVAL